MCIVTIVNIIMVRFQCSVNTETLMAFVLLRGVEPMPKAPSSINSQKYTDHRRSLPFELESAAAGRSVCVGI